MPKIPTITVRRGNRTMVANDYRAEALLAEGWELIDPVTGKPLREPEDKEPTDPVTEVEPEGKEPKGKGKK